MKQSKREQLEILGTFLTLKKKDYYYKPVRADNFWSNSYIEYERNGDRNKTLSIDEYLNKNRPYLEDINNVNKSYTWNFN